MEPKKYKKRPVTIEALEFGPTAADAHNITVWLEKSGYPGLIGNALEPQTLRYPDDDSDEGVPTEKGWYIDPANGNLMIRTLEGDMRVSPGDFVIKGVQGEFYPCKPDIFAETYEPARPNLVVG